MSAQRPAPLHPLWSILLVLLLGFWSTSCGTDTDRSATETSTEAEETVPGNSSSYFQNSNVDGQMPEGTPVDVDTLRTDSLQ